MIVRHQGRSVNVASPRCPAQDCYQLGQDKGTYVQGRGYTSYHAGPRWVCMTRHVHGCPSVCVCATCSRVLTPPNRYRCPQCGAAPAQTTKEG